MAFSDQRQQIGFEAGAILARMLEQQLNQTTFPGTKVSLDTATGQAMQHRHRLLRQKFFKFVGGHNEERDWQDSRETRDDRVPHVPPVPLFSRPFMAILPTRRVGSM